ncbi:DUF4465 domain-containing protein [Carboxylicivirga linearis]|uniref:DUF4465 domain-containing protein n=1 Tax=Carboxylicivirga linearis TaxID=1628157 RepID=A0ABS5K1G0_9BACT|nr:DUF4465 domain-containing protein [Carboxylicivirga linearis]MBS2100524.1 DUF4465 domain-containing protein [Carboxylicivirga linearis]
MKLNFFIAIIIIVFIGFSCNKDDKAIPAPTIYLSMPEQGFDVDIDSSFIIEPKITYDISSSYAWILEDEIISTDKDFTFFDYGYGSFDFTFTVTTPSGVDSMFIPIYGIDFCTFEEIEFPEDSTYHNSPDNGFFSFKYIQLSNDYNGNYIDWSGFAVSSETNQSSYAISNQFSVYNNSGSDDSDKFGVFKQSDNINHQISFSDGQAHQLKSIDVNNSTLAYLTMNEGFKRRDTVDFFRLTISSYDENNMVKDSIEYYLADYRYPRTSDKFIISTWKTVDLSALGEVNAIGFKLASSFDNDTVYTMPNYFCFDNLKINN